MKTVKTLAIKLKRGFYKLLRLQYWRKGRCLKCGNCCRTITLRFPYRLITSEEVFERLKSFMPRYNQFFISGKADNGVLFFTCIHLNPDNTCSAYKTRSLFCRVYPHFGGSFIKNGGKPLPGCGYYYEPLEKFDETLIEASKNSKNVNLK